MAALHLFVSANRFFTAMTLNDYIQPTYSSNGEMTESAFAGEVGLTHFDPMHFEVVYKSKNHPVRSLLAGLPHEAKWVSQVPESIDANVAIVVYEPNRLSKPQDATVQYVGCYQYEP